MTRAVSVLLCLCLLVRGALASDPWVVRQDGVGPIKTGMSLAQLNSVLNEQFSLPTNKEDQGCFYVHPKQHPHVSLMIEKGRLVRIDVDSPGISTSEGIQVGDSEAHATKIYGARLKADAHQYTEGHYLTVQSTDGNSGLRFETDKGKITTFYAGSYAAIQYVEGCS